MKLIAFLLVLFSCNSYANSGRFLPTGENNPLVVANVFHAPAGEVQVLKARTGEVSAVLRSDRGGLAKLQSVSGPARCGEWLDNGAAASGAAQASCILLFRRDSDGVFVRVDARDLERGSLFGVVKTTLRGMHGAF